MAYIRKTRDVWRLQGNYGYGWETECEESTRGDGLQRLREYRENGPGAYRLRKGREPIEADNVGM